MAEAHQRRGGGEYEQVGKEKVPSASAESPRLHLAGQANSESKFCSGGSLAPWQCGTGAAPRGGGGCGRSAALPRLRGFPWISRRYLTLWQTTTFPSTSLFRAGSAGSLPGSRHLLPSQGARRGGGGAELGSPGPAAAAAPQPPRAGAEPAAHGGGSRGSTRWRTGRRAAPCGLLPASSPWRSAPCPLPQVSRGRGAAPPRSGQGRRWGRGRDAPPKAAAEPRGNGAPAPACASGARAQSGDGCLSSAQDQRQRGGGARAASRSGRASGPCGCSPAAARAAAGRGGRR